MLYLVGVPAQTSCENEVKQISGDESKPVDGAPADTRAPSMGAKILCLPLRQPDGLPDECIRACGRKAKLWALFGRSY